MDTRPEPRFSVIVPVFNSAPYLPRVVAALQAQDEEADSFEMIFVDNGSSDGSVEFLKTVPGITLLFEEERGSYAARNRGVEQARGEILAFTDSDCYPAPGWLSAINHSLGDGKTKVVLGSRSPANQRRMLNLICAYEEAKAIAVYSSNRPEIYFGYTNNMAMRREIMKQLGPFDRRQRGADTIFVRRVVEQMGCDAVGYNPEMLIEHGEMESLGTYYDKVGTYARSRLAYWDIMPVRPLSLRERLAIYREASRELSLTDSALLLCLLCFGAAAWWWGRFRKSPEQA